MKRFVLGVAALMFAHGAWAEGPSANDWKRSTLFVTGVADIDAQGNVQQIELLPNEDKDSKALSEELAPLAKSTMSHWGFEPATEDGKPVAGRTFLHGVFEFQEEGSSYKARLAFIGNGPEIYKPVAPKYPKNMMSDYVQATLNMIVRVQPDGSITDIHLESAQSTGKRRVAGFVQAAMVAMKSWRAEPETVDGHPTSTWVRVPISFNLRDPVSGRRYAPELERSLDSPEEPPESSSGDLALALDSRIKIRPQTP
ncbi:TonB family protein [Dyella amyloliquefaciens]|uniref:TonB family protein n=1 Tax=Dyella amyloliquefaciens TaxID=1770545 RepID=UPI00102E3DF8|nr:TonB family protein [Dyella amyloliquefaciens]